MTPSYLKTIWLSFMVAVNPFIGGARSATATPAQGTQHMNPIKRSSVEETWSHVQRDTKVRFIDVRELDEVAVVAAQKAQIFPMSTLDPHTFESTSGITKNETLYILCRSGNRSMRVASALAAVGYQDLHNVEGGILAWEAAGLPLAPKP